jgi:hypothetical protein
MHTENYLFLRCLTRMSFFFIIQELTKEKFKNKKMVSYDKVLIVVSVLPSEFYLLSFEFKLHIVSSYRKFDFFRVNKL